MAIVWNWSFNPTKPKVAICPAPSLQSAQVCRPSACHERPVEFSYYKDKNQLEVDIVMESGNLVAEVEVKAGATVMPSDFRGLRRLKEASGERPVSGVVP